MKQIACYITGGWTECGAMQSFLRRINPNLNYRQRCPNKPKGKKGIAIQGKTLKGIMPCMSGLTGEQLIKFMYQDIDRHPEEISPCSAILLEDDLDGRFHSLSSKEINAYRIKIQDEVNKRAKRDLPVIFLFASPEIETWFIADWKNSFASIYKKEFGGNLTGPESQFFSETFLRYIKENILKQYYDNLEDYGSFDEKYLKISDILIDALALQYREYLRNNYEQQTLAKKIIDESTLYYSKRLHGDRMLRYIQPENVLQKCKLYFSSGYHTLHNL